MPTTCVRVPKTGKTGLPVVIICFLCRNAVISALARRSIRLGTIASLGWGLSLDWISIGISFSVLWKLYSHPNDGSLLICTSPDGSFDCFWTKGKNVDQGKASFGRSQLPGKRDTHFALWRKAFYVEVLRPRFGLLCSSHSFPHLHQPDCEVFVGWFFWDPPQVLIIERRWSKYWAFAPSSDRNEICTTIIKCVQIRKECCECVMVLIRQTSEDWIVRRKYERISLVEAKLTFSSFYKRKLS